MTQAKPSDTVSLRQKWQEYITVAPFQESGKGGAYAPSLKVVEYPAATRATGAAGPHQVSSLNLNLVKYTLEHGVIYFGVEGDRHKGRLGFVQQNSILGVEGRVKARTRRPRVYGRGRARTRRAGVPGGSTSREGERSTGSASGRC